ncbi:MAG: Gfo/Idh/MocA family oxidoreductase [Candidatus Altiarchaeota archaeon]
MESLKAAVIGVGAMGVNHARIYSQMQDVQLVGVCDIDKKLASNTAEKFKCTPYSDYDQLLSKEKPDLVSVAVPTQSHAKVALACIEEGTSILLEKPIADTLENAKKIEESAKEAGVKLMVGHIERFNPAVVELKNRIEKKQLGRIFSMHATRIGPFPHRIRDVGVVIDLAVHDIDVMRYVTGSEVKRVYAETEKRIHTKCEDMLSGLLKFGNGVVGVLDVNWLTPEKIRELTVTGEKGMFQVKYITQELTFFENRQANGTDYNYQNILMGVTEGDVTHIRIEKKEPLKAELDSFVQSVRKNTPTTVTGLDGLKSLEVALAISESATNNRVILL